MRAGRAGRGRPSWLGCGGSHLGLGVGAAILCCGGRLREGADILDCGQAGLVGGGHLGLGWGRPSWIGGSHLGLGVDMLRGGSHLGLRRTSRIGSTHLGLGPRWVGGGHLGLGRPYWGWRGHLGLGGGSGWGQPSWIGGSHVVSGAALLFCGHFCPHFAPAVPFFNTFLPVSPPHFPQHPHFMRVYCVSAFLPLFSRF